MAVLKQREVTQTNMQSCDGEMMRENERMSYVSQKSLEASLRTLSVTVAPILGKYLEAKKLT